MTADPTPCSTMTTTCTKCGHPHDPKLCQGHVVKDPETREPIDPRQCAKTPVKGSTVCRSHGAAKGTPAAAKAAERQTEAQAEKVLANLWPGLDAATPVKDPVASLERLAGALEQLVDQAGERVTQLQQVAGGKDLTQLRAEVVLLERALGHLRAVLVDMARLGIAERQIQVDQQLADIIVGAFRAALGAVALVPADKQALLATFLGKLGDVVPGEVVA